MPRTGGLPVLCILALAGCGGEDRTLPSDLTHDLGELAPSLGVVMHAFRVENPRDVPLHVVRFVPSCRCILSLEGPVELAPHAYLEVPVRFDLSRAAGPFIHSVRLLGPDLPRGYLDLTVRGRVLRKLRLSPEQLDLGSVAPGVVIERRIVVSAPSGARVTAAAGDQEVVQTEVGQPNDLEQTSITVNVRVPSAPGRFESEVLIQVTGPLEEQYKFMVSGITTEVASVRPQYLLLRPGSDSLVRVELRVDAPAPQVEAVPEAVLARVEHVQGRTWQVRVTLAGAHTLPDPCAIDVRVGDWTASVALDVLRKE